MSTHFPRVEAACAASTEAMALQRAAKSRTERLRADNASHRADTLAREAYGQEMLPLLFGGGWHPSRRHADFPYAVLTLRRDRMSYPQIGQTLFDHPLVYRQNGTRGPDGPTNVVIIGRPYPIAQDGKLSTFAREDAAQLAAMGWGTWWRPDLSTHYPGWTQLVVAKHGLQAIGAPGGQFWPIASPDLGVAAWDEWTDVGGAGRRP